MFKTKHCAMTGLFVLLLFFLTLSVSAAPPKPGLSAAKPQTGVQPKPIAFLTVTLPKNGDYWQIGEYEGVYWNYNASAGKNVNIWLYKGNVKGPQIVSKLDIENTVHHWKVPESVAPGNDYRVMIESVEKPAIQAYSPGFFTIRKVPTGITVMAPNGGQAWIRATTQTIGWIYTGKPGTTVNITLESPGAPSFIIVVNHPIYQQLEHMGSYKWLIPGTLTPGSNYKIKIQVANTQYADTSDQSFIIK
ncbi:MAG: hypothetical protein EHM45_24410 [Desulfobacteraceae bacterium]|nr:MAG: hypothetical protein EHM45_24410 [Desulfobacteraceae bacterium]